MIDELFPVVLVLVLFFDDVTDRFLSLPQREIVWPWEARIRNIAVSPVL